MRISIAITYFLITFLGGAMALADNSTVVTKDAAHAVNYQPRPVIKFNQAWIPDIKKVESYLSNITTLTANFRQTGNKGGIVNHGKIYLSRPGKLRWSYESPDKIDIFVNDDSLVYHDKELDQVSYSKADFPIIEVLISNDISFAKPPLYIIDVKKSSGTLSIMFASATGEIADFESDGRFTFVFNTNPFELARIHTINRHTETMIISLMNLETGKKIDENIFVFKNQRLFNKKRKN